MTKHKYSIHNCTPIQMKFQLGFETIIEIYDPIYTFNEIVNQIDLRKYFVGKGNKTGRSRFDCIKMLKIILLAFMENGYASLRNIEKRSYNNYLYCEEKGMEKYMKFTMYKKETKSEQYHFE